MTVEKREQEVFFTSKKLFTSTKVLVHFDPTQEIVLSFDALSYELVQF